MPLQNIKKVFDAIGAAINRIWGKKGQAAPVPPSGGATAGGDGPEQVGEIAVPSTLAVPSVIVGYTANYALHVHENIEMKWRGEPRKPSPPKHGVYWGPAGQAKFLEQPAREMKDELAAIIRTAVQNGATLEDALFLAGLALQRASQALVPVDTGNLKNSAFTRRE